MSVVGVYESVSSALSLRMKVLSVGAWLRFIHPAPGLRLPSFSGHPISTDLVSAGEDVHCESTAQEIHAGVPA